MDSLRDALAALVESMGIDSGQADRRRAFLEFDERDAEALRQLHERLGPHRLGFVEDFYGHLMAFRETRALIEDPATLERLKRAQGEYFERLTGGVYDWGYVADRLRVGVAHQQAGVEPEWYLGGYRKYLCWLLPVIARLYGDAPDEALKTFQALIKVVFFDLGLALDTYIQADRRALAMAKEYISRIVASVPCGLIALDENLRVLFANRWFVDRLGLEPAEGRTLQALLPIEELHESALEVLRTGITRHALPVELRGEGRPPEHLRVTIAPARLADDGKERQLLLVVKDVTREELLRTKARLSDLRFRTVVESSADGVVMAGEDGIITHANDAAARMFGHGREDLVGRPVTLLVPESYREQHLAAFRRYLATGRSTALGTVLQVRGLRNDGSTFAIEATISACRIDGGQTFIAILRDIEERQRAEEALWQSATTFRTLIERSPDAVAVHRHGRILYVNPTLVRLLGYGAARGLVGKPLGQVIHPEDLPAQVKRAGEMLAAADQTPPEEQRFLRRDGSTLVLEVAAMPVFFGDGPAVMAIGRDISKRLELTARMMEMDRLIAVGTLAAGVGHEINNPLTYVAENLGVALDGLERLRGRAERLVAGLRRRLGDEAADAALKAAGAPEIAAEVDDLRAALGDARAGAGRIRDIAQDLRVFSRSPEEKRAPLDIHKVIEAAIAMASHEIRHRAKLVKEFGRVEAVCGAEGKLTQIFLNLLVNAAHSIDEGAANRNEIRVRTFARGNEVAVEVRDTGRGIPAELLPRLFTPFFTTKPVGQGTGLGLAICRQIAEAHGGRIEVASEVGRGSMFRVLLPMAPAESIPAPEPAAERPAPLRRCRILVIDDEPRICRLLERALGSEHDVLVTTNARAALARIERGEQFDVVLCDVMMPDVSGMDFHDALLARDPSQAGRIVFMTGGAFTARAREFLSRIPNPRIDKPFQTEEVLALIRSLVA